MTFLELACRLLFRDYPDVVTAEQLQKMLGISRNTVYELLESGNIPQFLLGKPYQIPKLAVVYYVINSSHFEDMPFEGWTAFLLEKQELMKKLIGGSYSKKYLNYLRRQPRRSAAAQLCDRPLWLDAQKIPAQKDTIS